MRSWWVVPGACQSAGRSEESAAIRARSSVRELRRLFAEEPVVIVADLPLGPQRLLPPLLQGSGHQAVLRVDGPVAPFGVLGLVPGPLQPLFPVLVQAGAVPLDVLHGPTAQLQRGGFQGAKDLLRHQVVDHRGLEAEARLFGPLVEMPDATVIGPVLGPVGRLEATAAVAADDEAGEQRGAVAGAPLGAGTGAMLTQAFLIRQVALPGDVGRQAVALQDLPLLHRDPVAGAGAFPGGRPDALVRPAAIGVGPRVDRVPQDLEDGQQDRAPPLQVRRGWARGTGETRGGCCCGSGSGRRPRRCRSRRTCRRSGG